jgi:prepilin-type N-terminal cleavage/methylation domain-containing protein
MSQPVTNRKSQQGFTIIEVLIVLAIAGLILMIVFLAVPALQRNSRNTQRKNDVQALLGAISEYEDNNNGSLPATGDATIDGSSATLGASTSAQATANLGYYNSGTVTIQTTAPSSVPDNDTVLLVEGYTCDNNKPTTDGANRRSIAAYYSIEPGTTAQCVSS